MGCTLQLVQRVGYGHFIIRTLIKNASGSPYSFLNRKVYEQLSYDILILSNKCEKCFHISSAVFLHNCFIPTSHLLLHLSTGSKEAHERRGRLTHPHQEKVNQKIQKKL